MDEQEIITAYEANAILDQQVYDYDINGNILEPGDANSTYKEVTGWVEDWFVTLTVTGHDIVSASAR